jgi:hypothetical protein
VRKTLTRLGLECHGKVLPLWSYPIEKEVIAQHTLTAFGKVIAEPEELIRTMGMQNENPCFPQDFLAGSCRLFFCSCSVDLGLAYSLWKLGI